MNRVHRIYPSERERMDFDTLTPEQQQRYRNLRESEIEHALALKIARESISDPDTPFRPGASDSV